MKISYSIPHFTIMMNFPIKLPIKQGYLNYPFNILPLNMHNLEFSMISSACCALWNWSQARLASTDSTSGVDGAGDATHPQGCPCGRQGIRDFEVGKNMVLRAGWWCNNHC